MPTEHAGFVPTDPLTGIVASRFGVYIHFPYCLSKCPYCDFASTAAKRVPEARYTQAVLSELETRAANLGARQVDSVFFGGGTPSLWAPAHVASVLAALTQRFSFARDVEVTLEANPGAADAERFAGYRAAGVNRLSIGVQSFQAGTLAALGRAHGADDAVKAFASARAAGFTNISMDFIYGVHGQRLEQVEADAQRAASLGSEHLSAYALTLDKASLAEEVPLAKQLAAGVVHLPPDDEVVAMQRAVERIFAAAGLRRYEVSNYARPGQHSRHNTLYWTGGEYLALGCGATGFVQAPEGALRSTNLRSAEKYLSAVEAGELPQAPPERLGAQELLGERIAMGLRLTGGIDIEATCRDFGVPVGARTLALRQLEGMGLMEREGPRVRLTARGFDVHSTIAAKLM